MPTEAELIQRASQRDPDAFGELYALYLDRIFKYVFYKVGNTTEAEDLTEHVFLKAWEAIDKYNPRGYPFSAWLYRIAHNTVIDYYRGERKSVPLDDQVTLADKGLGPEEMVERKQEVERLRRALAQLPDEQRQVIILRFIQGRSHAEVAAIMGKGEGACRVLQCRALKALQRILEEG